MILAPPLAAPGCRKANPAHPTRSWDFIARQRILRQKVDQLALLVLCEELFRLADEDRGGLLPTARQHIPHWVTIFKRHAVTDLSGTVALVALQRPRSRELHPVLRHRSS